MNKCAECPVSGGNPCLAVVSPNRFAHFCGWAKSRDPQLRKVIVGRSAIGVVDYPPGLLAKAKNFTVAAARHLAAGSPKSSDAQKNARLAICRTCEHFENGGCRKCGCGMDIKAGWADSSCPLDPPKWSPIPPDQRE